ANFKDSEWLTPGGEVIKVPRGSFISSLGHLAQMAEMSVDSVRWGIRKAFQLQLIHPMDSPTGNPTQFTFISIVNYDRYQGSEEEGPTEGPQGTTRRTPREPQQRNNVKSEERFAVEEVSNNRSGGAGAAPPDEFDDLPEDEPEI